MTGEIVGGPTLEDLLLSLRLHSEARKVTFSVKGDAGRDAVEVTGVVRGLIASADARFRGYWLVRLYPADHEQACGPAQTTSEAARGFKYNPDKVGGMELPSNHPFLSFNI